MRESTEKYLSYASTRDVVFFFGAGTSYADGAPLQKDILPFILSDKEITNSAIGKDVKSFLDCYFAWDPGVNTYPKLESVFALLEHSIRRNESLSGEYPTTKLSEIRESLIKLVYYSIAKKGGKSKGIYRQFWERIKELNRNVSVITTNYDVLLDEAFDFLYPDQGFIDYCLNLMNYDHYEAIEAFDWWEDPRKPVQVWGGASPRPIKIIKVHGSLNWKYCSACAQVLLTPWDTDLNLSSGGFMTKEYGSCEGPPKEPSLLKCPIDGALFGTLIVPPSYYKSLEHPAITTLMHEAARELRIAKKIVFVGYSFPESDVHLKALLHRNLQKEVEITVINRSITNELALSFKSLSDRANFIAKSFEDVLNDVPAMRRFLAV